ncbi:MAG: aspartate aminotransferase family protein [Promethearchaeota archaeon]
MDKEQIIKVEDAHDSRMFNKKIAIASGAGAVLRDVDGTEYIDCVGGHGVSVLGYSHPRIVKTLCKYLSDEKPLTCGHFYDENRAELMARLVEVTPPDLKRIFFSNSGTEAVEAALKFAMKYRKDVERKEIISFKKGFHGRTLGALSTTFEPRYRKDYSLIPGISHASYNSIDSVRGLISENTVAIIMELVQGEGGVHPAAESFPAEVREVCDDNNITLIFDEVQTGFGRTGKLFALEHWGVEPDILCLAKGIAAGIPMGATITTDAVMDALTPGAHATTFGGNPFACAAAVESLRIIHDENLLENATKVGEYMFDVLEGFVGTYKQVKEIRGKGLMIGIQFRMKVRDVMKKMLERGVLVLNAGMTVLRLLPPIVLTMDQAKTVLETIETVLESL